MKFKNFIEKQEEIYNPPMKKEKYIVSSIKEHICSFVKEQIISIGKDISFNEEDLYLNFGNVDLKISINPYYNGDKYTYIETFINEKKLDIRINPQLFYKKNTKNYLNEVENYIKRELSPLRSR